MRIFLLILLLVTAPSHSHACEVRVASDPRFLYAIDVNRKSLPDGVEVVSETRPSLWKWQQTQPLHFLINKSSRPVYLFEDSGYPAHFDPEKRHIYGNMYVFPNSELPAEYKPKYKLVDGMVYYYTDCLHPDRCASGNRLMADDYYGYKKDMLGAHGVKKRMPLEEIIEGFSALVSERDDHSGEIKIPEPKGFSFRIFYDGEVKTVTGRMMFAINEDYDPKADDRQLATSMKNCAKWSSGKGD